jgi:two-component SAPR family response regulator
VIVCSGYAELPELKMKLQGLPLLPKPWSPEKLARLIDQQFQRAATAQGQQRLARAVRQGWVQRKGDIAKTRPVGR